MKKSYTQAEINQILLSKSLNDLYFAIIEHRAQALSDEEYDEVMKKEKVSYGNMSELEVKKLYKELNQREKSSHRKNYASNFMRLLLGMSQMRMGAILTMIGDEVYDVTTFKFIDLKKNKIVRYDSLTNYYSEKDARIRVFTKKEAPQLAQDTVTLDVNDESIFQVYTSTYATQEESYDLTKEFIDKAKGNEEIQKQKRLGN